MPSSTDKSTLCPALSIATITSTSSSGSPPLLPLYQSFTLIQFDPQLSLQTADVLRTLINQRYHSRASLTVIFLRYEGEKRMRSVYITRDFLKCIFLGWMSWICWFIFPGFVQWVKGPKKAPTMSKDVLQLIHHPPHCVEHRTSTWVPFKPRSWLWAAAYFESRTNQIILPQASLQPDLMIP